MAVVRIDSRKIHDWASFHEICKEAFGFPAFYGMNMNAFIDCLTYIDEGDGMSNIILNGRELLRIELLSAADLSSRLPEIVDALSDSVDAVNQRFIDEGKS